ncbi:fungal-specific transcription factor domain-containing protein [Amylocystis lapponica]|nr:fungal-specific transcription factor domain-containing protein [Amylocystis lapponica]
MQSADLHGWAPPHSTTVIDLEEHATGVQTIPAPSSSSLPYYGIDTSIDGYRSKKRKIERACDFCRRRKTKCDGPKMQGNVCTNCQQNSRSCTYLEGSKPRGPRRRQYVTGLEDRVEKIEALLRRLRPEADFSAELGPPVVRDSWKSDSSAVHTTLERPSAPSKTPVTSSSRIRVSEARPLEQNTNSPPPRGLKFLSHVLEPSHNAVASAGSPSTGSYETSDSGSSDGEDIDNGLIEEMKNLSIKWLKPRDGPKHVSGTQWRFHGKSSLFKWGSSQEPWRTGSEEAAGGGSHRRPHFWKTLPWEIAWEGHQEPSVVPDFITTNLPPLDLADHLIDIFFRHKNSLFPLLHRPTFERQWRQGLHKTDLWFACMCMALFGVASRFSDDPRVLGKPPKGEPGDQELWSWAGWKFIEVAMEGHRQRRSVFLPVDLFEVQSFVLLALYLRGSAAHAESWTDIGIGLRKAQDVGANRRKVYGRKPTVEEELWKRAYWHLVTLDRIGSMLAGRPCASREEDLDLDLPLEVDDEYWENDNPELAFQQPCSKPSTVSAFVYWIKLSQIAAFALRTLYALGASKEPLGLVGPGWREEVVAQVNDALTDWVDNLPEHLHQPSLHVARGYYVLQITVYRPFIPANRRYDSPEAGDFPLSALSICVNAAKAGTQLLELQARIQGSITNMIHFSFVFAGVLLVNLWTQIAKEDAQTSGHMYRIYLPLKEDISRVKRILEDLAPRWHLAKEASQDIENSLPSYIPSHKGPLPEQDPIGQDGTMNILSSQHGILENPLYVQEHAPSLYHADHPHRAHSRPSINILSPSSSMLPLYSGAYNNSAPALIPHSGEATPLWTLSDLPSSSRRFVCPEPHSTHEEWFPEQAQVPLRHPRSTSHLRSTYNDLAYSTDPAYIHTDTGVLPSGEIVLRDPSTIRGFDPGNMGSQTQTACVKREHPDDGQPMHLFPVEYRQAPSSSASEYIAPPEMLTRQASMPNPEQYSGQWSRSNYRWEQWRVHGYSS